MAETHAPPTLRALLSRADLRLRLESSEGEGEESVLDRPVRWVHSSDLVDPTPFLSEGLVLLTTGTQFATDAAPDEYEAYVRRLRDRGVVALGFGTEVVREGIPASLARACAGEGLPLFEVPYRTPFIAVARANAEAIAANAYARRTWALAAQRAVSLAALRPDGLSATLAELARQLDAWVGLFDPAGTLRREHPRGALDAETHEALAGEVAAVLRRGARAGSALQIGATSFTLQTLGRGGHLRGVIAITGGALDAESRTVVTSVIALAGLALEQNDGVSRARAQLRVGVVHALLAGEVALARRFAKELWGGLPTAPVVVGIAAGSSSALETAAEWLEARAADGASLLFGRGTEGLVFAASDAEALAGMLAERFGVRVGLSSPVALSGFVRAHDQAATALHRGHGDVSRFGELTSSGVFGALDSNAARLISAAILEPLAAHDAANGSELLPTVRAWLENDARLDVTASALGVHRHTVRARIAQVERVLDTDLSSFPARAELWTALRVADG